MNTFIRSIFMVLVLVQVTQCVDAQDHNEYRGAEAVLLRVNGNDYTEKKLEGAIVALPNYSDQLTVWLNIPYSVINDKVEDDRVEDDMMVPSAGLSFSLRIKINLWKIQESLTSDKTFNIDGFLTLNDTTKLVTVEYSPLPSATVQEGGFNLNMIIAFNADDFNLGAQDANTRFFIRIGDAPVNRL
ncbi:MAG TPA: hypothetical protein VK543_00880 [Puia sp.]|nr:hypothetical protein [Puia sp.]